MINSNPGKEKTKEERKKRRNKPGLELMHRYTSGTRALLNQSAYPPALKLPRPPSFLPSTCSPRLVRTHFHSPLPPPNIQRKAPDYLIFYSSQALWYMPPPGFDHWRLILDFSTFAFYAAIPHPLPVTGPGSGLQRLPIGFVRRYETNWEYFVIRSNELY